VLSATGVYFAMKNQAASAYKAGFDAAQNPVRTDLIPSEGGEDAGGGPISSITVDKSGKSWRTFNFGNGRGFGMGYISVFGQDRRVPAKGTLTFPLDTPLSFDVEDKLVVTDPKFLLRFNTNDFVGLRFRFNFGASDSTFRYLDRQKNLQILDVTGCDVSSQLIEQLNKLPKLETLRAGKTNLTGHDLLSLKRLHKLKSLNIARTAGQGEVLRQLKNSNVLEDLRVSLEDLSPQDIRLIGTCKNLKKLWIDKAEKLTDKDLTWISNLHNLEEFCPIDARITSSLSQTVRAMPKLRLLAINGKLWSKADIARFRKVFPKIELAYDDKVAE